MAIGILCSTLALIKSSTTADVLAPHERVPHSAAAGLYKVAAQYPNNLTIVTITGPLTFASSENLEKRLETLVQRGQSNTNPAALLGESIIILNFFNCNMDNCTAKTLFEMVECYRKSGSKVWFHCSDDANCQIHILYQLTRSGILQLCGGLGCFFQREEDILATLEKVGCETSGDLEHRAEICYV